MRVVMRLAEQARRSVRPPGWAGGLGGRLLRAAARTLDAAAHTLSAAAQPLHGAARLLAAGLLHLNRRARGRDRIRVPRRLGELLAAIALLPLGAVVTLTVAATSDPAAVQVQGPPLTAAESLASLPVPPLSAPQYAEPAGLTPPPLTTMTAAPALSTLEEVDGMAIPASTYTSAQVEAIITTAAQADGVDPSWMIRTAECESTLRPDAYNPSGPYYGLFQFLMSTFKVHGGTDIWDPVQQSDIAASMFASGDSSAWPVCSHA